MTARMVHDANQIALFFSSYPKQEAVAGIADHFTKFWERRMRNQILDHVAAGGHGLDALVIEAVKSLK
ncbi:MAG: formate dehydrogenase subunit delta [Bryobacteraceae bacterium]